MHVCCSTVFNELRVAHIKSRCVDGIVYGGVCVAVVFKCGCVCCVLLYIDSHMCLMLCTVCLVVCVHFTHAVIDHVIR